MAVLQIAENDPMLSEYYKRLDQFSRKAKEHAKGDEHQYLGYLINFWSVTNHSDKGLAEVCIDTLKKGIAGKDYALMQAVMNFVDKSDLLWQSANGCDHSYMAYHTVKYLSCAHYDNIYRAFPKGLPPASNGHTMNVHAANIILSLLYEDDYDREKTAAKAEKYILSKQPKWDRAFVGCLLGIMKQDTDLVSDSLQTLCALLARTDVSKFDKMQCQFAYGMLAIAYHILPQEKYTQIRMLEYGNFDPGYLNRLLKEEFSSESMPEYTEPYEIFNTVLSAPISVTKVHQPYLDSDGTAREKKQYYMDCDRMNNELIEYVMHHAGNKTGL